MQTTGKQTLNHQVSECCSVQKMPMFASFSLKPRAGLLILMCVLGRFSQVLFFATLWTLASQALLTKGILQARILEWDAMPSSKRSSQPRDQSHISCVSCIGRQILYHWCHLGSPLDPYGEDMKWSCSVASDSETAWTVAYQASPSMGFFQARILEWVAISYSRRSSRLRNPTQVSCIAGRCFTDWAMR